MGNAVVGYVERMKKCSYIPNPTPQLQVCHNGRECLGGEKDAGT